MLNPDRKRIGPRSAIHRAVVSVVLAALAAVFVVTASPAYAARTAAQAAGPRPLFQLPFLCGEKWTANTYQSHNPIEKIDFLRAAGGSEGRPVLASAAGRAYAGGSAGAPGGFQVAIDHGNGWATLHLHLQEGSFNVPTTGRWVEQGEQIARVGNTGTNTSGAHLHYEQVRDASVNSGGQLVYGTIVRAFFNGVQANYDVNRPETLTSYNCGNAANAGVHEVTAGADHWVDGDTRQRADVISAVHMSGSHPQVMALRGGQLHQIWADTDWTSGYTRIDGLTKISAVNMGGPWPQVMALDGGGHLHQISADQATGTWKKQAVTDIDRTFTEISAVNMGGAWPQVMALDHDGYLYQVTVRDGHWRADRTDVTTRFRALSAVNMGGAWPQVMALDLNGALHQAWAEPTKWKSDFTGIPATFTTVSAVNTGGSHPEVMATTTGQNPQLYNVWAPQGQGWTGTGTGLPATAASATNTGEPRPRVITLH
jgi:hypothetical protein